MAARPQVKTEAWIFGCLIVFCPLFGLYSLLGFAQSNLQASRQQDALISQFDDGGRLVDSKKALSRARFCSVAQSKSNPNKLAISLFGVDNFYSPRDGTEGMMDGHFLCALDGSTTQILDDVTTDIVFPDQKDMEEYYLILKSRGVLTQNEIDTGYRRP